MRKRIVIVVVAVLVAAIALVALLHKPLVVWYTVSELRDLRAQSPDPQEPALGTAECMSFLFAAGAVTEGMTTDEVSNILGKPGSSSDDEKGNTRWAWLAQDLGGGYDRYVVVFGPDGKAIFVPWVRRRYETDDGHTAIELVRTPEGGGSAPP